MSAAKSYIADLAAGGLGLAGLRLRADEYFALGETSHRYELVDGVVMMSPSPLPRHAKAVQEILFQLELFARAGGSADFYTETDLQIDGRSVYRPDICVYAAAPTGGIPDRLTTPPALVVEVLSPGSQALDLITKREEYQRLGVLEYWVVDPADARVRAWRLDAQNRSFGELAVRGADYECHAVPGFTLDLLALERALARK
jgi:Uma2 family endonuclease